MPINSIPPAQPAQQANASKNSDLSASRKQSDNHDANRINDKKDAELQRARVQQAEQQNAAEPVKPAVNSSGQKIGTLINVAA